MRSHKDPLPYPPKRVLVAGVSGVGKTTLARRIAAITGGPHTEIDAIFHGPDWTPRPEISPTCASLIRSRLVDHKWQYDAARPLLRGERRFVGLARSSLCARHAARLVRRTIRRRSSREDLWNGNIEAPLWTVLTDRDHIVRWAIRSRRNYHAAVPGLIPEYPHLTVVRLRSQQEAEEWLAGRCTARSARAQSAQQAERPQSAACQMPLRPFLPVEVPARRPEPRAGVELPGAGIGRHHQQPVASDEAPGVSSRSGAASAVPAGRGTGRLRGTRRGRTVPGHRRWRP